MPGKSTSLLLGTFRYWYRLVAAVTFLYSGYSVSAGFLLVVIFFSLVPADLEHHSGTRREFLKKISMIVLGSCFLLFCLL